MPKTTNFGALEDLLVGVDVGALNILKIQQPPARSNPNDEELNTD